MWPLAAVILGGLVTSTLVTLLVLPALYLWVTEGRTAAAPRPVASTLLLVVASLGLYACAPAPPQKPGDEPKPAVVETIAGSTVKKVTLTPKAAERLGVTTVAVRPAPSGRLVVPYTSLVYDSTGVPWVYTVPGPLTYVRAKVAIDRIAGGPVSK